MMLTVSEVAERLRVSEEEVYTLCRPDRLTNKAALANYRIGTRVVVEEDDLERYKTKIRIEASYS